MKIDIVERVRTWPSIRSFFARRGPLCDCSQFSQGAPLTIRIHLGYIRRLTLSLVNGQQTIYRLVSTSADRLPTVSWHSFGSLCISCLMTNRVTCVIRYIDCLILAD